MDKEDVKHICNGILLTHKKGQNWITYSDVGGLQSVTQSEASQKEKNKFHILMHIHEI